MSIGMRMPAGLRVGMCECGRGVFATRAFQAQEQLGQVLGNIIATAGYGSQNCMDLGKYGVLEPAPPFQFLNHCCDPNCELQWDLYTDRRTGRKRPRIFVHTLRAIEPGEQLTLDYAWAAEDAIPCKCQSPRCRGWVVAEEELHLVPGSLAV